MHALNIEGFGEASTFKSFSNVISLLFSCVFLSLYLHSSKISIYACVKVLKKQFAFHFFIFELKLYHCYW